MSGCCPMMPRCPSCHEPLAPKNLDVTCGSCGHKFHLPPPGIPRPIVFTLAGGLLLILLLLFAMLEERSKQVGELEATVNRRNEMLRRAGNESKLTGDAIRELKRDAEALRRKTDKQHRLIEELQEQISLSQQQPSSAGETDDEQFEEAALKADVEFLEKVVKLLPTDADAHFRLARAYGLLDQNEKEITHYERSLELKPGNAEAHFRASLAYDRSGLSNWSVKSFEHAKKAIKLDPGYKKKFQPMIRNSKVAKKVAAIIHEIIQKSEDSQLPDEEAARYAEEIGKVLGDNDIKSEQLGDEAGNSQEAIKDMLKDPAKRQKLRQYWDSSNGTESQPDPAPDLGELR